MFGRSLKVIPALAVITMFATSCSSSADQPAANNTPTTTSPAASTTPRWPVPKFVESECPMDTADIEVEVTCGTVEVPENRSNPKSRMIKLAVARIHSSSTSPAPDPVVQLEGGPGFASLIDIDSYAKSAIVLERDYILWDQRGTGFSSPNLDCSETNEAVWTIFETTDSPQVEGKVMQDSMRECRKRLVDEGVDLNGYNTTENAADLADLRVAMGIEEWNLRGISYGSALAIETVRSHPEGIRSVLLDSIVAPDIAFGALERGESALRAFNELYEACAAEADCSATYGDLHVLFTKAADALDATPYETKVTDSATGEDRTVRVTGKDLWAGLFNALYDETLIPQLPAAAKAISEGDNSIIELIAQEAIPFAADQHEAMTASVTCADRSRLLNLRGFEEFADEHPELGSLLYLMVPESGCEQWGVNSQSASLNELLKAGDVDVPILLMAGRFDPITPPEDSQRVAEAMGEELLLFPDAGHGAVTSSDCAQSIWFSFLDDPATTPDAACIRLLTTPDLA